MKSKLKKVLVLSLSLVLIMLVSTGCTIGIKEKNNLIIYSPVPIPEVAKGAPIVATEKPIPLVILDEPDKIFYRNMAGYVLVDQRFFEILIKTYNGEKVDGN